MNMKYLAIFSLLILALSISAISASQETNEDISLEETTDDAVSINQDDAGKIIDSVERVKITANESSTTQTKTNTTTKTVTKTTVSTPDTAFIFKRNSNLKITIKDKTTKQPIKNLKITFKIKNNKKYKTYTLKTNSKGVAKFSTKKLSLGHHKFIIKSKNNNYKVSKKDYVFIGNLYYDTLNMNTQKKLKNGDAISTFVQKKNGQFLKGVHTDLWYTGGNNPDKASPEAKFTQLIKAKFFFKNKKTGKIITITSKGNLVDIDGEIYRDQPHVDLMKGYVPIKTKIGYLISK